MEKHHANTILHNRITHKENLGYTHTSALKKVFFSGTEREKIRIKGMKLGGEKKRQSNVLGRKLLPTTLPSFVASVTALLANKEQTCKSCV